MSWTTPWSNAADHRRFGHHGDRSTDGPKVAGTYWLPLAPLTQLTFWVDCANEVYFGNLGSFRMRPKVAGTYWLPVAPLTRLTFWGVCANEVHFGNLGSFRIRPKVAGTYWLLARISFSQ
jgi:hypothetical protein